MDGFVAVPPDACNDLKLADEISCLKSDDEISCLESADENSSRCAACHQPMDKIRIHYGGISCYSCRSFFRRRVNIVGFDKTCRNGGSCKVEEWKRKSCIPCRYSACLRAGMRPDCILSEEKKKMRFWRKFVYTVPEELGRRETSGETESNKERHLEAGEKIKHLYLIKYYSRKPENKLRSKKKQGDMAFSKTQNEKQRMKNLEDKSISMKNLEDKSISIKNLEDKSISMKNLEDKSISMKNLGESISMKNLEDKSIFTKNLEDKSIFTKNLEDKSISMKNLEGHSISSQPPKKCCPATEFSARLTLKSKDTLLVRPAANLQDPAAHLQDPAAHLQDPAVHLQDEVAELQDEAADLLDRPTAYLDPAAYALGSTVEGMLLVDPQDPLLHYIRFIRSLAPHAASIPGLSDQRGRLETLASSPCLETLASSPCLETLASSPYLETLASSPYLETPASSPCPPMDVDTTLQAQEEEWKMKLLEFRLGLSRDSPTGDGGQIFQHSNQELLSTSLLQHSYAGLHSTNWLQISNPELHSNPMNLQSHFFLDQQSPQHNDRFYNLGGTVENTPGTTLLRDPLQNHGIKTELDDAGSNNSNPLSGEALWTQSSSDNVKEPLDLSTRASRYTSSSGSISYRGGGISYRGGGISYRGGGISYSGGGISYRGGGISLPIDISSPSRLTHFSHMNPEGSVHSPPGCPAPSSPSFSTSDHTHLETAFPAPSNIARLSLSDATCPSPSNTAGHSPSHIAGHALSNTANNSLSNIAGHASASSSNIYSEYILGSENSVIKFLGKYKI